ncbi:unnamed protein product [Alopecurus aequalis]
MAAPPPVLTLAVEKGPREGETRQCRAGAALRVGRVVSGNDLAVRDVGASQRHLAIEFLPPPAAQWAVSDLGSSNGTFLNGARLVPSVPVALSHGDRIILGESTALAVSIAPDSEVKPGPRRSSRRAAAVAVVEEKPTPSVIRRSTRKKEGAAGEPSEAEKEEPDAAVVVAAEEKPQMVIRRSRRNKAAAAKSPEAGKEEIEEVAGETRRGRKKKAVEPPEPEKVEEHKEEKAAAEEPEKVATRRMRRKNAEPSELYKGEEGKDALRVTPPPLPPKTRSTRARGRACAKKTVLEEEEVAAPREEGDKVTCGDGDVEGTADALEEVQVALIGMTNAQCAVSDNVGKEIKGGGEEEDGKREAVVSGGKVGDVENAEERAGRSSLETMPVARSEQARRAPKRMTNAQCAASDNGGEEIKGGGEEEQDDMMEAAGNGGEVEDVEKAEKHAGRSSLETMTLGEWFDRMEKYLPRTINEAADEMISTLDEQHRRIYEYISTLGNSNPS